MTNMLEAVPMTRLGSSAVGVGGRCCLDGVEGAVGSVEGIKCSATGAAVAVEATECTECKADPAGAVTGRANGSMGAKMDELLSKVGPPVDGGAVPGGHGSSGRLLAA